MHPKLKMQITKPPHDAINLDIGQDLFVIFEISWYFLSADCQICTADGCKQSKHTSSFSCVLKMEELSLGSNTNNKYTKAQKNLLLNIVKTADGGKWHGIIFNEVATNNGKRFQ